MKKHATHFFSGIALAAIPAIILLCGTLLVSFTVGSAANKNASRSLATHIPHHTRTVPLAVPAPSAVTTVHAIAFGDIMLDRFVETLMQRHGDDYPFSGITPLFENNDIVFANLEGPIVEQYVRTPDNVLRFSFPPTTGTLLKREGFTTLSVANNHGLDHGEAGSAYTRTALTGAGIDAVGHSARIDTQYAVTKQINGQTIVFLGFHATQSSFDANSAIALVQSFAHDPNVFVIISMHWGAEYQLHSNAFQQRLAHTFIDAGADLILGQHPHVVQEVSAYKNRAIFYSLGNCIFDQYFSVDTQQELGVAFSIHADSVQYTLLPLQSVRSRPSPMEADAKKTFLAALAERSAATLATQINDGTFSLTRD